MVRKARPRPTVPLFNNRQRRYKYSLLADLRTQPARDILSATVREREDQAQSRERSENNSNWARILVYSRQEILWQRLALTVTEGTDIKSAAGVEHTELVVPEMFRGDVAPFTSYLEEAARVAS